MAKTKKVPSPKHFRHRHKPRAVSIRAFERAYWPYLPLLVAVGLMFSLVIRGGAWNNLKHPNQRVLGYATSMNIKTLLKDTNTQRAKQGLPALKLSSALDSAAEAKAQNMTGLDYWSHNTPSGNPPWVFVASQNYSYQALGENLAAGFNNEGAVVGAWMASTEHRANILNQGFSQVGFGVAQSSDYKAAGGGPMTLVVAYYAKPAPVVTFATAKLRSSNSPIPSNTAVATSHANLALAGSGWARFGTLLAVAVIAASAGLVAGRHIVAMRKSLRRGERFIAKHPLVDLALVVIIFLAYITTQTAGFIK